MHREPEQFVASVKKQYPEFFTGKRVLEVGSLDINGSARPFFTDCNYTGIDLGEGAGVDVGVHVADYHRLSDGEYDVIISTETLEHDHAWNKSLVAMYRLLKPNGLLLITCAAPNRPEHGTTRTGSAEASPFTSDYYRNISIEDFASVLPANLFSKSYLGYRGNMDDLYFAGIKKAPIALLDLSMGRDLIEPRGGATGTISVDAERKSATVNLVNAKPLTVTAGSSSDASDCRHCPCVAEAYGCCYCRRPYFVFKTDKHKSSDSRAPIFDDIDAADDTLAVSMAGEMRKRKLTVTAEISSKDRYHFLPLTISAILNQTHKPDRLVIYDDGEQKDLRTLSPFDGLLRLADHLGIKWEFFSTPREGQVRNHQHCLDTATTDLIFRCDDDCIPGPDCLEKLLAEMTDGVGAVAPLIHHPCGVSLLPDTVDGSLNDVALGMNMQWFDLNGSAPREVSHLYSGFLYRTIAGREAGGYPKDLSVIGHHEETIFSHNIKRAGYVLKIVPAAKMYHFHESTGGIRSFSDTSLWEHDDRLFQEYLKTIGNVARETTLKILDSGIGDHLLFRALLVDEFKRKFPDRKWRLAVCYPDVFEGIENVELISIAEAKQIVGDRYSDYSLYEYGWHHGNGRHILDVMREFYGR